MPYPVPDLIAKTKEECQQSVQAALQAGHDRMCRLEKSLDENTALTREVVDILGAMKGGIRVLGWLGAALKWGAGIAGALYTIYCIYKGKSPF